MCAKSAPLCESFAVQKCVKSVGKN
uniref:Uncharacterized protein n=1 Tax=Anopheles quadriannulatus TaxID=34691 RepID=A0A182XRQ7_ANOQN